MNIPIQYKPKYIEGYEGLYGAVRAGFIYSFISWRFKKCSKSKTGYLSIILCKNGDKQPYMVHRLIAQTFIQNPNNLPEVNHINEVKDDNRVCNLEWCTASYNRNYGNHGKKISEALKGRPGLKGEANGMYGKTGEKNHFYGKHHTEESKKKISIALRENNGKAKPVLMFTKDGQFIRRFNSVADANEFLGKDRQNDNITVSARDKNGKKTAWGYKWKYEQLEEPYEQQEEVE